MRTFLGVVLVLLALPAWSQLPIYPPITPVPVMTPAEAVAGAARALEQWTQPVMLSPGVKRVMPRSYSDTWGAAGQGYWAYLKAHNPEYQQYVAKHDLGNCTLSSGNEASVERVIAHNGLDTYDGAVWTIALARAATDKRIPKSQRDAYRDLIQQYRDVLVSGNSSDFSSYRAWQGGENNQVPYGYGPDAPKAMPNADAAFILKFIAPTYAQNVEPIHHCQMTWPVWGGVTGEAAWASLIGPIQTAYLLHEGRADWVQDEWVDLAIHSLPAFVAMQDPVSGGLYRNVLLPGQAAASTPDAFSISLENNFSAYAGLSLVKVAIEKRLAEEASTIQAQADQTALAQVTGLLTHLRQFFLNGSGKAPVFNQSRGVFYSAVSKQPDGSYQADSDFAVDVQTWGISVMRGYPELEKAVTEKYGAAVFTHMWKALLSTDPKRPGGGYFEKGQLKGVGYTSQKASDPFYTMSGEWTLGAINAALALGDKTAMTDAKSMTSGIHTQIETALADDKGVAYLYANKRVFIPFGWFSNAMPATSATGWGLLVNSCYDPFVLGGATESRTGLCRALAAGKLPR